MDKVAIISDIHGNMQAFETVLDDIQRRGIDLIYCLGDLAGKGPDGDLTIDLIREKCQVVVRGNWDTMMAESTNPSMAWWHERLGVDQRRYLHKLPNVYDFLISGKRIRLYHASHIHEFHRILAYSPYTLHRAMFTNTAFTGFNHPEPDIVGYGDIHAAFMLSPYDTRKLLFNVGSVGNPLDIPLATYAIMTGHLDSEKEGHVGIDFIRLPYDIEGAIQRAKDLNMPEIEAYANELRTAVYRGRK